MVFGDSPTLRNDRFVPSIHAILQAGNLYVFTINNPIRFIDPTGLKIHLYDFEYGSMAPRIRAAAGSDFGGRSVSVRNIPPNLTGKTAPATVKPSPTVTQSDTGGVGSSGVTKGWKVGQPIDKFTAAGNPPKWNTVKQRYWKNEALLNPQGYTAENLLRMERGLAPQQFNDNTRLWESMHLHHVHGRDTRIVPNPHAVEHLMPLWPDAHREWHRQRR
jgi:hypothetical protein